MRHRLWLHRVLGGLTFLLLLGGPAELLIPDDCDGHAGSTVCPPVPGTVPASGHVPSTPHVCHDFHGHGSVLIRFVLASELAPRILVSRPERFAVTVTCPPSDLPIRPPIV